MAKNTLDYAKQVKREDRECPDLETLEESAQQFVPDIDKAELMRLKEIRSHANGKWRGEPAPRWNDHRWQLQNRIKTLSDLESHLELCKEERAGMLLTGSKLSTAINPYYFQLIDSNDPACPIRRQVFPRIEETRVSQGEMSDPCGEDSHMPVPGLVHRYPDRVLFLTTDQCASYCRYCTRSRVVSGAGDQKLELQFRRAFEYLREHDEVRDVLLSGGDPLMLSDSRLERLLAELRSIKHIEIVRIGTRIPVFMPQRVTPKLCQILAKYHPLWLNTHVNHPREITEEFCRAAALLSDHGIPVGNQSVLLRGVNDDATVMTALCQKLVMSRVRPYYLYQCDLIKGSEHLRVSIRKGLEIMRSLRGFTSGYAVPQYVIDAPGGGGKTPINPEYIICHDKKRVLIRNYEGKIYEYPELDN